MLLSKLCCERTKDAPGDAKILSHILLSRAGYIKQVANGIYSLIVNLIGFLPAPYAFAFFKNLLGKGSLIMIVLMIYGLFGCVELFVADFYMRVKKIKLYRKKFFSFKEENKK